MVEDINLMIDNIFSPDYQYYKGQYCVYNGVLYRANKDIPVGTPFDLDNWEYRQIGLDLYSLNNSIAEKSNSYWNNLGGVTINGNGNYTFITDEYSEYILVIGVPVGGSIYACKTYHIPALLFLNQGYQFDYYNSANYRYSFQLNFTNRTNLNVSDWSMGSSYTQMSVRLFGRNKLN